VRYTRLTLLLLLTVIFIASPSMAWAQMSEPPDDALLRLGPVVMVPVLNIANAGTDSNVFGTALAQQDDVTAQIAPTVSGWIRLRHAKINTSSAFTFNYYRTLSSLRGWDNNNGFRAEFPLRWLTPFVSGSLINTRQPVTLEIDAPVRSRSSDGMVGLSVSAIPRLTLTVYGEKGALEYQRDFTVFGVNFADSLNHESDSWGLQVNYSVTPYTRIGVDTRHQRDLFYTATASDADNVSVAPFVEFSPSAMISGRVSIGVQERTFRTGTRDTWNGGTAQVNLSYVLLGQARLAVDYQRQLQYSYTTFAQQYLGTSVSVSVNERLGDTWDAFFSVGRGTVAYQEVSPTPTPDEVLRSAGGGIGYRVGKTRASLSIGYQDRSTAGPIQTRSYDRVRVGASLTYEF